MRRASTIAVLTSALLWAAGSQGDIIHLKGGARIEGKVLGKKDGRYEIRTASGIVTYKNESEVVAVERRDTPRDIYLAMTKKLPADDAEGRYALAMWCRDHGLNNEMKRELVRIIQTIDPDHARAREALGYVRTPTGWMPRDDARRARGMVRVHGRWMTKEEAARRRAQQRFVERSRAIDSAVYRICTAPRSKARECERRLADVADPALARKMIGLLKHRHAAVRRAACLSLARMKHHDAVPILVARLLFDSKESVRDAALSALRQLDRERTLDALYDQITGLKLRKITSRRDQRKTMRTYRRLARALAQLGDVRSVPFLIEILYPQVRIPGTVRPGTPGNRQLTVYRAGGDGPYAVGIAQGGVSVGTAQVVPPEAPRYFYNQAAEDALKKFTGQDLGVLPRNWRNWWRRHGSELLRRHEAERRDPTQKAQDLLDKTAREPD